MATILPESVKQSVKQAVMGSKGGANAKLDQLAANMVEPSGDTRITSDFGTKQTNTDHWLGVNSPEKTGPMLLEDGFGREKVLMSEQRLLSDAVLT